MASSGAYVEGPRHAIISSDNVGPVITIVTLFLMVVTVLAVALRLLVRLTTTHVPGADDAVVIAALFFALGEVIAITLTVNNGLGTRRSLLTTDRFLGTQRGIYAANIFYLLTIATSKASTLLLLQRLTVARPHKMAVWMLSALVACWALAAVFGIAFACDLPRPWDAAPSRCFDRIAFWDGIGALDIFTDVSLIFLPTWLVWSLQMHADKKAMVVFGFTFRIFLCAAQLARLVYLHRFANANDVLYSSLGCILATQFETLISPVVACIPAFRPFMDRAASGLLGVSFAKRAGTYELSSMRKSSKSNQGSKSSGPGSNGQSRSRTVRCDGDYHAEISATSRSNSKGIQRQPSTVQRTVEWEVRYSDEAILNQTQAWPEGVPEERAASRSSVGARPHESHVIL